ncbi:phosphoadenylyl-sulfate reductase [Oryzibacter oryziterrae]|uniref:phosphoadenylyl-sulfate reductase n=1 Tax=Oryzibacter oryziterrae TaxID=2766474 RepID=UPI001F028807|nr:phosphoadenylyl-sulfate reductase [Oryzibacter oryziterrae]
MVLDAMTLAVDPDQGVVAEARLLSSQYDGQEAPVVLRAAIEEHFSGEIALVSSFGADSAVLLHMVAGIDRNLPVVFIDTGKLFGETLRYRDSLVDLLQLTDVRSIQPQPALLQQHDPEGALWLRDTDACCAVRKVQPLSVAMEGFSSWITGRKRFQAETRTKLPLFEADGDKIKVNPLAGWNRARVEAYREEHGLPAHGLVADGYLSIGCMPCTDRVKPGEDERAGRWRGQAKTECGIHLGLLGHEAFGSGI